MKVKRVIKVLFVVTESMFFKVIDGPLKGPLFFYGQTSSLKFPVKTANTAWNQVSIRCSNALAANILQPASSCTTSPADDYCF